MKIERDSLEGDVVVCLTMSEMKMLAGKYLKHIGKEPEGRWRLAVDLETGTEEVTDVVYAKKS